MDRCAKCGEASTDAEFCSECGAPMQAASAPAGAPEPCPVCGEARPTPLARFCDTCRFDFVTATPFPTKPAAAAPPPTAKRRWELLAQVDETLRKPEDPPPTGRSDRLFPLDLPDHLIGRRSDSADIHPEIVIPDPGISRRHARILRQPDGSLAIVDLGSMNGTRVNGTPLEPNVIRPLAEGDDITLGCWTRLMLRTI